MSTASNHRIPRPLRAVGIGAALAVVGTLVLASAASAHVRVTGIDVSQGGYGVLSFRVPTESATASTTELTVTFPSDTPIAYVSTQPMAGWTATLTTAKLTTPITTDDGKIDSYVASVDWKANSADSAIKPGQFQIFNVSAGPLPKAASVSFPSLQTYSDGTTVNWNEKSTGGAEPEHPAPVLQLPASSGSSATPAATDAASPSATPAAMDMSSDSGSSPVWLGILGLVLGALGLLAGVVALARTGRKSSGAA